MPLQSSKVAPGIDITADQFNKLREDLLTNHDHSSDMGGVIDHKDLKETKAMSGMAHMHEDLDVHVNGGGPGPTDIDNPGGSAGVHGLHPSVYVPGVFGSQLVFRCGEIPASPEDHGHVSFSPPYSVFGGVVISTAGRTGWPGGEAVTTGEEQADGFRWDTGGNNTKLYWIAWGTM